MTATLTRTAARIYGTLSGLGGDSTDVLLRLIPFFDPLLRPRTGERFDIENFASEVRKTYRWNFNSDVVEVFIPHLIETGWLTADNPDIEPTTFHITQPETEGIDEAESSANEELRALAFEFKKFSEALSPLTTIPREVEEFEDILIEWLLYVEAFSEGNLEFSTRVEKGDSGTLSQVVDIPRTTTLKSEERFLCARFVEDALRSRPEMGERLARIAAIGLLTEVVQDFVKPTTPVEASTLVVYLDAPVAMEYLGVSGRASQENTTPVIDELKRIGAQVRIFGQSIEEIKRNLGAVLDNPRPTGPTAQALARNEVIRDFVKQVHADPEAVLGSMGVATTYRTLDQTPSEHPHFPESHRTEIFGSMIFQKSFDARNHDADVTTLIMRQRHGQQSRDIFKSRFVLATRNGLVAQLTRKKCVELGVISPSMTPPIVHRRYLTASMWLRTGLGAQSLEVPKRLLLANCERVLAIRPGVIEAATKLTEQLDDPEKVRQLNLLVSNHRSAQALMDKTLGIAGVVTSENISELFDEMIHPHLEEERKRGSEAVQVEKEKARLAVQNVESKLDGEQASKEKFQEIVDEQQVEDIEAISALCQEVEGEMERRRNSRKILGLGVALLFCLPMLLEPSNLIILLLFACALGLAYLTITGNQIIGTKTSADDAHQFLSDMAKQRRLDAKFKRLTIDWKETKFVIEQKVDSAEDELADKLL